MKYKWRLYEIEMEIVRNINGDCTKYKCREQLFVDG